MMLCMNNRSHTAVTALHRNEADHSQLAALQMLSGAHELYIERHPHDDAAYMLTPAATTVGVPKCLRDTKTNKGDMNDQQWADRKAELREKYGQFIVTSKIDTILNDVRTLLDEYEEKEQPPPKVVIYSNFKTAFRRIKDSLAGFDEHDRIPYACASARVGCSVCVPVCCFDRMQTVLHLLVRLLAPPLGAVSGTSVACAGAHGA